MTLFYQNDLNASFATVLELQAFNTPVAGASAPTGIPNRLFFEDGWMVSYIDQSDPQTYGGIRSELRFTADNLGEDVWYCFDVLLAEADWQTQGNEEITIFQIHTYDAISGTSIDVSAVIIRGILKVTLPSPVPPTTPIVDNFKFSYPAPFGRAFRVALHGNWKTDSSGVIEVYIDRVPIFRQYNVASAYTADHPYLKMGAYDAFHSASFGFRRSRYRNLKIYKGTGPASYTEVLGGRPLLPRPLVA